MKEKANPAIVAAAVVLLVLIIGFMGWKFLGPGSKGGSGSNPYGTSTSGGPPSQYMPHSDGGSGPSVPPGPGGPGSGGPGSGGQ
ncbi:MAG: hypothetical protein JWL77_5051 [Chthonomonadaceae bacterium]|nr:hypothetical protein [Chthonomonadaceae bacterium]